MQRIAPDEAFLPGTRSSSPVNTISAWRTCSKTRTSVGAARAGAKPDAVFAIAGGGSLCRQAERLGLADLLNVLYLGVCQRRRSQGADGSLQSLSFPTLYEGLRHPAAGRPPPAVRRRSLSATPLVCGRSTGPCAAYIDLTANPGDVDDVTPATAPTAALLENTAGTRAPKDCCKFSINKHCPPLSTRKRRAVFIPNFLSNVLYCSVSGTDAPCPVPRCRRDRPRSGPRAECGHRARAL